MAIGGAALRLGSTALYALEFCCAGIILGIYSYFLAVQADRNVSIPVWQQAVTGMAGGVVLYTIFAVLLTCFLGGKSFFALLGMILDLACAGAMIAIAVLTRDGASSCTGDVETPLGNGPSDSKEGFGSNDQGNQITYSASLGSICRLNTACFAVAILGAFLFLISIPMALFLSRHHKKEKRYGPSPSNGYTRGSGVKFWQRNQRKRGLRDPEVGTVPATTTGGLVAPGHDVRPSHDTAYTGSTVAAPGTEYAGAHHKKGLSGGYHTAPTGTYHNTPATNY
ncbi:hypothetical protein CC86DRAFT_285963 [Ophiobolus disseminans]|uniref:MARVEL domain-containing protein n=1 Tax=Ophiobolus disseminans TaxID=1469910 RepID=A0A6A7AA74_9PLEO|nr:hypothetical protein CC86DRAFT_285963 [Ophiobolus disseminans]